ncbi:hypothetical protein FS749_009611 [Ceratobasidium sp. UAMH 11750]|nr:hypothetical protein FS749_009611 [Ceratobasidium sp. UAMH 11750]
MVVSMISPPALHILEAATFNALHTITVPNLALPAFSLSRRLLAYASTPPPPSASPTPTTARQSPSKVQANISMAIGGARKVGAGAWSRVKTLLKDGATSRSSAPLTRSSATNRFTSLVAISEETEIESALTGSNYDPLVRWIVLEGIYGWWNDQLEDWTTCSLFELREG